MDILRRILSFIIKPEENAESNQITLTVPCYYLGNTYVDQPNTDELRRAVSVLTRKVKKDLEKNLVPIVSICFEDSLVVIRDGNNHKCTEFEIRRIVVSCVDAKNQKHLAIFYHNYSPYIATSSMNKSQGLECHLFLCRNKDIAKTAANKIGELLSKEYQIPTRPSVKDLEADNVRMSKANFDDFDYENVSKFFQQKVFNVDNTDNRVQSARSSPYSSVSTFATTTGCDSGCASTIASVDIRAVDVEYAANGFHQPVIEEREESSSSERNSLLYSSSRNLSLNNVHNRYSVHCDREDQNDNIHPLRPPDALESSDGENDGDIVFHMGVKSPEIQNLLAMDETNI